MAVLIIDGLDISHYVPSGGISVANNDLDSEDSGRSTMDGLMHRSVVTDKDKLQVKTFPMTGPVIHDLFTRLKKRFFQVTYSSPDAGVVTGTFYSNGRKADLDYIDSRGVEHWTNISFPLIER